MSEDVKIKVFVLGIMFGVPFVLWSIQNLILRLRGRPTAPVGTCSGSAGAFIGGSGDPSGDDASQGHSSAPDACAGDGSDAGGSYIGDW